MVDKKSVSMIALKTHTFGSPQQEYHEGDAYEVHGDNTQTADQYADTLTYLGFARVSAKPAKSPEKLSDAAKPEAPKAEAKSVETKGEQTKALRFEPTPAHVETRKQDAPASTQSNKK